MKWAVNNWDWPSGFVNIINLFHAKSLNKRAFPNPLMVWLIWFWWFKQKQHWFLDYNETICDMYINTFIHSFIHVFKIYKLAKWSWWCHSTRFDQICISANLNQKYLILGSAILLDVLHKMKLTCYHGGLAWYIAFFYQNCC